MKASKAKASKPTKPEEKQPSKRSLQIQRYLAKQRYQRRREEWEERHQVFVFDKHPDAEDPTRDVKRIQRALELDDMYYNEMYELGATIRLMELCAGNQLSDAPLDVRFLAALQRVSDYHYGRMLEEEWNRVCAIGHAWRYVEQSLDEIDRVRKERRQKTS